MEFLKMNPRDARAVTVLLRRQHGPGADAFCAHMIEHFERDGRTLLSDLWRVIRGLLPAASMTSDAQGCSTLDSGKAR
jgi:hypothetical protein